MKTSSGSRFSVLAGCGALMVVHATSAGTIQVRVGGETIDGDVPFAPESSIAQRRDGVSDGRSRQVEISYEPTERLAFSLISRRFALSYGDMQVAGCELSVGGITRQFFCQPGTPANRTIDDRGREWKIESSYNVEFGQRFSLIGTVGYGILRWGSDDDREAATFSNCQLNSDPAFGFSASCIPVSDRSQAAGWTLGLAGRFQVTDTLSFGAGAGSQGYRHDIYRFTALDRFGEAARRPCEPFDWCANPRGVSGRAPKRGNWWWYTAALDWRIADNWSVGLDGSWGGSRDWETLGATIGYRW